MNLTNLEVEAIIGVHAWERAVAQTLLIDLELSVDITAPARSDELADALDYAAIAKRLTEFVSSSHYHLLEALAEQTAQMLLAEFAIPRLRLKIRKPMAIPNVKEVSITVERSRDLASRS